MFGLGKAHFKKLILLHRLSRRSLIFSFKKLKLNVSSIELSKMFRITSLMWSEEVLKVVVFFLVKIIGKYLIRFLTTENVFNHLKS